MRENEKTFTCCLRATAEEIQSDPEAFDCETCVLLCKQRELTEHDSVAMEVYDYLNSPVVQRLQLQPLVFNALGLVMTREEAVALLQKLDVLEADRRWRVATPQDDAPQESH